MTWEHMMPRGHVTTDTGCVLETRRAPGFVGAFGITSWWCTIHDGWWAYCGNGDDDDPD